MANPKIVPEDSPTPVVNERLTEQRVEITGVLLIGIALLSLVAILFDGAGFIGEILKRGLHYTFGQRGAIIPVIFLGVIGWYLLCWRKGLRLTRHLVALILLQLWALLLMHIFSGVALNEDNWDLAIEGGGVVGHFMALTLVNWFGRLGTGVFMLIWLAVIAILALDRPLIEVVAGLLKRFKIRRRVPVPKEPELEDEVTEPVINPSYHSYVVPEIAATQSQPKKETNLIPFPPNQRQGSAVATLQSMLKEKEKSKDSTKENKFVNYSSEPIVKSGSSNSKYKLPSINLVTSSVMRPKKGARLLDQSRQLEETLAHFGVSAKVIEVHHGPVITRYDLQPAPGVKVSRIVNLADDLALSLAARGLRLEAPIPGKAAIGIEVPNPETQIVTFRDVLDSKAFWGSGKLSVALGMDIAGEMVIADLRKMPHLLVAGATGSGKSVCVNTLIMSILFKALPDEVKFIMIDPKMVELSVYNGIPHLMAPVVTEAKKAAGVLKVVVDEMERRYKLFTEARVRDLEKYNAVPEIEVLPYIIVIIDELADLMMVAPVEVEDAICRLAQMARATGIHLVVATQRPSVDVITGLIKANIPSRIAFAVSSHVDSRTILDTMGAERLLGQGDMLFSPVGAMKPRRIQGALVIEKEIEAVIKYWKDQGEPNYQEQFTKIPDKKETQLEAEDELFWDAVRIIVENGQASASVLQRRLRIGYNRAARLIDMMEAKGMVGTYEGSKPREVYITARQMEEIKKRTQSELF